MRFIPTSVHGVIDLLMAIVLIVSPWLFGFDNVESAKWVPIVLGIGLIVYSLLTNYELGMARLIPMPIHLGLDILSGIVLAVSPWLFGFADDIWWPHVVFGLIEIGAGLLTRTHPSYAKGLPADMTTTASSGPTIAGRNER